MERKTASVFSILQRPCGRADPCGDDAVRQYAFTDGRRTVTSFGNDTDACAVRADYCGIAHYGTQGLKKAPQFPLSDLTLYVIIGDTDP